VDCAERGVSRARKSGRIRRVTDLTESNPDDRSDIIAYEKHVRRQIKWLISQRTPESLAEALVMASMRAKDERGLLMGFWMTPEVASQIAATLDYGGINSIDFTPLVRSHRRAKSLGVPQEEIERALDTLLADIRRGVLAEDEHVSWAVVTAADAPQ